MAPSLWVCMHIHALPRARASGTRGVPFAHRGLCGRAPLQHRQRSPVDMNGGCVCQMGCAQFEQDSFRKQLPFHLCSRLGSLLTHTRNWI